MRVVERIKRALGLGGNAEADVEGSDVTVHLEHPGVEEADPDADGAALEDIKGIGPTYGDKLRESGITSVPELAEADAEALAAETDISETRLATWIERARVHVEGP